MASAKVSLLTVTMLVTCASVMTQRYSDVEAAYKFVKSMSPTLRPVQNQSQVLQVFVIFSLKAVTKVDEVKQELSCNAWLNLSWTDQVRTWNTSEFGDLHLLHPDPTDLWRPRVMVSNSLEDRDIFKDDYSPISLFWHGQVLWYPGGVFHTSCKMDMTVFPFDTHLCTLRFLSNNYYASELLFLPVIDRVNINSKHGEWILGRTKVESARVRISDTETFTGFVVTLTLTRRPAFFLLNVVAPITLLSLLTFMVFMLPDTCGEKVTFATTILLSQAVYMSVVTELLPQNSDSIPLMLIFLCCTLLLCSLAVALSILLLNVEDSNNNSSNSSNSSSGSGSSSSSNSSSNRVCVQGREVNIPKQAAKVPELFVTKRKVFPGDVTAGDRNEEEGQPVKEESDKNTKRNLCCLARLQGCTISMIFLGLWVLMSCLFLAYGMCW